MRILIPFLFLIIGGCAVAPYSSPTAGDVAYLKVPKSTKGYHLLGGFSKKWVSVGELDENGCIGLRKFQPIENDAIREDGTIVVKANADLSLSAGSRHGNSSCSVLSAVKLEKDQIYKFTYHPGVKSCAISLVKLNPNGEEGLPIELARLKDKITKFCK
ncbi:MAG: hypothetical protein KUG82_03320 [Pseudomonadales bacterium]|nr:hypothetical protein [Pseudomonadales bacterium]